MTNNNASIEEKIDKLKEIVAGLENSPPSSEESTALLDQAGSCIEELLNELQDV